MKHSPLQRIFFTTIFPLLALLGSASAQVKQDPATDRVAQAMGEALQFRATMADGVVAGTEKPAEALARLQNHPDSVGLKLEADPDFAFGAIDIGRRLIVAHKPDEAEKFFEAAEASLTLVIDRTEDAAARDKAQFLEARANIRIEFLNKLAAGRKDLDVAIRLSPGNQRLQQIRLRLFADPAAVLQDHQALQPKS